MPETSIVSLIEVFRHNGKLYLVFEYVERTILEDLEKNPNGLSELDVKKIFYQLLNSLNFIHSHDIIHRDIKPGIVPLFFLSSAFFLLLCVEKQVSQWCVL